MNERRMSMTLDIGADISKVKIAAQELQNLFKNTSLDPFKTKNLQSMFNGLNDALADLEKRSGKALSSLGEGRGVDASKKRVLSYIQNIAQEFQELEGLGDTQVSKKIKGLSDSLEQSSKAFDRYEASMKSTKDQAKDLGKQLETLQDIQEKQERLAEIEKDLPNKRRQATRTSNEFGVVAKNLSIAQGNKTRAENRYKKFIEENAIQLTQKGTPKVLANQKEGITQEQIVKANQLYEAYSKAAKAYAELNKDAQNKQDKKDTAARELTDLENEQKTLKTSLEGVNDTLEETKNKVNQTQEAIKSFNQEGRDTASFEELKKTLKELFGDEIVKDIDNTKEGIQTLKDRIENISADRVKELRKLFPELFNSIKGLGDSAQRMGKKVDDGLSQFSRANEASQEIEHLASRLKYFFSLAGGFQLMRRAIRSATETTKELDAVMTQTAVVSKFTVGDMWKTLPEYSKYAKQLGTAIKDVYSAQTLYVQQGLNMDKAMDIGIETLKMARVANIDAAEATNSMTAALRGFNMELNETSAQRINDVYSKLAQNTASNTQEISTAMTKTAALANSANMSFENTAAFLATIIESTREGAETAGTALKTVIARFTEVKKLYSEGELLGTDEEGQEVDVNKISAALRTAGINMNDFFTGAKGLDEIFLELGSKWDSLTTVQQRYIATMAAGSRQQSRFLALMQNYNRTVELTQMAYNSAGSGQEQFEKTLDSLQAKIEKFKAEWQTFIMGIANSGVIKGVIDVGTKLLETINKIIDAISGGNGLVKSIASIAAAVGVFKAGKGLARLVVGLFTGGTNDRGGLLGSIVGKSFGDKQAGETAAKGFLGSFTSAIKTGDTSAVKKAFTDFYNKNINWKNQINPYEQFGNHWAQDSIRNSFLDDVDQSTLMPQEKLKLQYTYDSEGLKSATDQAKKMGVILDKTDKSMKAFKTNLNAIGNSCLMVGGALLALTSYLQSTGKIGDKTAKILKGISAAFIAFGGVLKLTQVAISVFSKSATASISSIPIIGWIAAVIAALIALSSAIADVAWETSAEKAERLANESEKLKEKLEDLKGEYTDLEKKLDELKQQKTGFDKLIEGTIEYDTALQNLNQSILSLIQLYPDLAEAVEYVNGKFVLNDKEYQKYLDKKKKELQDAQDMENIAELTSAYSERDSYGFWKGLWEGIKGTFLGWDNYEGNVKGYQGKVGTAVGDDLGRLNNVLNGFQMLLSPWKIFTADMYDRNGFYTDELNYLSEKIMEGTLIFDKDDDEKNKKSIETLLEFYKKDTSSTRDYGSDSSSVKEIYKVLKDYYSYLEDYGEKNKIIQQSKEKLKNNAIINTYENTLVSKTKYSDIFYKMASIVYDKVQISDEERAIKQKQKTRSDVAVELGYKKASDISEENYKLWIDQAIIQEKLTKDLNSYYSSFLRLKPEQKDLFSRLVGYEGLKGLTITEADKYTSEALQKDIDSLAGVLGFTSEEIYKLIGVTNIEKALTGLGDSIYVSINNLSNKDTLGSLIKSSKFQTIEEATTLAEKVAYIQSHGGNGQQFLTQINDLLKDADSNKLEGAKNIILNTDWYSKEDIRSAMSDLENLGIEIDNNFINQIIQATKAVSKFSTKNLEEQITSLEEGTTAAEKIDNGEKVLNNKEYENLANILRAQNPEEWDSKWVRTGIDEWTYIGEETNSILSNIDAAVSTLVSESLGQAKKDVQKGEEIKQKISNNKTLTAEYYDEDGEVFDTKQFNTQEFFESLYDSGNYVDLPQLRAAANLLGVDISNYDTHTTEGLDLARQAVFDYYDTYYGSNGGSLIANQEKVAGLTAYSDILPYKYTNAQSVINDTGLTQKEKSETLSTGVKKLGAGEEYMAQQDIATLSKEGKDFTDVVNALTINSAKAAKKFDNLTQSYKDNADALKKENKGTREYGLALGNLTKSVKTAFGNNEKITEDFVDEHLDLFEDYANGADGAEDKIRQAMMDEGIIEGTTDQLNQLQATIDGIDGEQLSINGTADCSQAFSELAALYGSAEAAAAKMEALGYSVTWEPDGETTMLMSDGSTRSIPNYKAVVKDSAGNAVNRNKGGGGGGGGGGKEFKNDFDKYYNMVEDINELERLRNLLETDYEQLLKSEVISGKAIYDNLKKQIQLLKERRDITADLAEKRKGQIFETMDDKQYASVRKYAWWNDTDQTIEIDWDAINKVKDSEQGDLIKEYVSKLEGFQSQYDEQIEALEDIESTLQEIQKRGQEEYTSLEDRTRDALIKQIQDKIDELTAVDEAINDTNQKLMDSIQKELEKQRQERENAKTEEELADKEQRLAYLQQDSSGANALEIAKLQEELADARENYTDSLIDQKITELQEQNDEAAQQRQEQIDLMQQSLDWQEKSGAFWEQVYEYIQAGTDEVGTLVHGSELENLLKAGEAWDSLSEEGQMKWLEELENQVAQAIGYLSLSRQLEEIGTKEGTKITFTDAEGNTHTGTVDKNGNVVVKNADGSTTTWKDVYQSYDGSYQTLETRENAQTTPKPATNSGKPSNSSGNTSGEKPGSGNNELDGHGWYSDNTYHWHQTKGGTVVDQGAHVWDQIGTPEAMAGKTVTCNWCGRKKTYSKKSGGGGCFAAGTKIIMSDFTTKNIEDVLIGDEVVAYNEEKELFEFKKVTKSYKHYNTPRVIKVSLSNNVVLKITPGHPILTTEGWKSRDIENSLYEHNTIATWLNIGDQVIGYSGIVVVENIVEMEIPNNYITYNIEVEVCHTYLADGIVVHNMKVKYATGGLNTETGLAWLDGTKSHPELVLNARDTENFIQLKDHLATLRQMSINGIFGSGGDNYYDIDVHVDSLGSDYDVDMAIDRIKARLYQDGAYRNVNTLNRLR